MAVSSYRTIVLPENPRSYDEQLFYLLRWPLAEPDEVLDYSLDLSAELTDDSDAILSASISAMPSGSGELTVANASILGNMVTVWLSGGVPGRDYLVRVEVQTTGGRVYERLINLLIDPTLAVPPPFAPPDSGFGPPAVVSGGGELDFSDIANSALLILI